VVIGHAGDSTDLAYLEELIANGSYLGMDRFGIGSCRCRTGCDRGRPVRPGYADRLVLGHDSYCFNDRFEPEVVKQRHPTTTCCTSRRTPCPPSARPGHRRADPPHARREPAQDLEEPLVNTAATATDFDVSSDWHVADP